MISRITGQLVAVRDGTVTVDNGGLWYELMVPAAVSSDLQPQIGATVTLNTLQYFEGNPAGAHLIPRLIGFLTETDRSFFNLLTRVKGISNRKALKAMAVATHQLAAAIAGGDERLLTGLPEIGKKTAATIVGELRDDVQPFLVRELASSAAAGVVPLNHEQRVALEILVQWGDRRADAQRWIAAAMDAEPGLKGPDAIVRAAYRVKGGGG